MRAEKLIRRARQLASLKEGTSEGWEMDMSSSVYMDRTPILQTVPRGGYIHVKESNVTQRQRNLLLASAAPEMADLLKEMADKLEALTGDS